MQAIVDSDSAETLKFWWKVSSDENDDYIEFYIDGDFQNRITDQTEWARWYIPSACGFTRSNGALSRTMPICAIIRYEYPLT